MPFFTGRGSISGYSPLPPLKKGDWGGFSELTPEMGKLFNHDPKGFLIFHQESFPHPYKIIQNYELEYCFRNPEIPLASLGPTITFQPDSASSEPLIIAT